MDKLWWKGDSCLDVYILEILFHIFLKSFNKSNQNQAY